MLVKGATGIFKDPAIQTLVKGKSKGGGGGGGTWNCMIRIFSSHTVINQGWVSNHAHYFILDVIPYPYPNGGLNRH